MSFKFTASSLALAALLGAGASHAQQQPQPNPLVAAALAEARNRGWKFVCSVVDSGAALVSFKRMDGAQLGSIDISLHKARAAAKFRRETKSFEAGVQGGFPYLATLDDLIASRGGIPLIDGGKVIGAIGCSGGTGSQDEVASKAGVAALK